MKSKKEKLVGGSAMHILDWLDSPGFISQVRDIIDESANCLLHLSLATHARIAAMPLIIVPIA